MDILEIGTINDKLQELVPSNTSMIMDKRKRLYTLLTLIDVDIPNYLCDAIDKIILSECNDYIYIKSIPIIKGRFRLYRGDITKLEVDVIVNAANSKMLGCFNPSHKCIDNIIHSKAGPRLRMECRKIMNKCNTRDNKALITRAYCLPSKYIIHIAGPIYDSCKDQSTDLANCYLACLNIARVNCLRSIAFCCISTGLYGYPKEDAAKIAICTTKQWMKQKNYEIDIVFNTFTDEDTQIYKSLLQL